MVKLNGMKHHKRIPTNEKYKREAFLQKTYTVDFLAKKKVKNNGEVSMYYEVYSHPVIIDKEIWEAVQLEMEGGYLLKLMVY